jgi:hypothetical protein
MREGGSGLSGGLLVIVNLLALMGSAVMALILLLSTVS